MKAYDEAVRAALAANDSDCLALMLAARARALGKDMISEAAADALRAISLFGGDRLGMTNARTAAARLARTVAAVLTSAQSRAGLSTLGLAADYAALASRWEPQADVASVRFDFDYCFAEFRSQGDARLVELIEQCLESSLGKKKPRRKLSWRQQRCNPVDVDVAARATNLRSAAMALERKRTVVGLGCGRCGTSSLSALLSTCGWVSHESSLPDCRVVLWKDDEAAAARRLREWRLRRANLVGDVNYAHLPCAEFYLKAGAKIVGLRRSREETVRSFYQWTEPGGAPGSVDSRDHWRIHDGSSYQFDEWDFTFPKYHAATSKLEAIYSYYDDYYAQLTRLEES